MVNEVDEVVVDGGDGAPAGGRGAGGSRRRWLLRRVAVVLAACTLVPTALLYAFQDQFVFYGGSDPVPPIGTELPRGRTVAYRTDDGTTLEGWFIAARTPPAGCAHAATILLFHGQNQSRASEAPLATALAERGLNVMLAEYRGFGGMDGAPSEDALQADARAAVTATTSLADVDPSRLVLAGYSLGTGVAATLATEHASAGLILLAPYTNMADMAWHRLPVLPYSLLMKARFDTVNHVAEIDTPVLVVASATDDIVPFEQSERVFAAARHPDALARVDGLNHGQVGVAPRTLGPITDFAARVAPCSPSPPR